MGTNKPPSKNVTQGEQPVVNVREERPKSLRIKIFQLVNHRNILGFPILLNVTGGCLRWKGLLIYLSASID